MSEEPQRPLSRRELRLREGWVAEDANLDEVPAAAPSLDTGSGPISESFAISEAHPPTTSSIPVIGPDGQLMSRRQLRELWAAEEAAAAAEAQAEAVEASAVAGAETEREQATAEHEVAPPVAEAVSLEAAPAPEASGAVEPPAGVGETITAEREPSFLEVISSEGEPQQIAPEELPAVAASETASPVEEPPPVEPVVDAEPPRKLRFPWARKPAEQQVQDAPGVDTPVEPSAESLASPPEQRVDSGALVEEQESAVVEEATVGVDEVEAVDTEVAEAPDTVEQEFAEHGEAEPESAQQLEAQPFVEPYTFPEVSPEPEARSIFDRPDFMHSQPSAAEQAESSGAFDDIIERAVADEGAASPTTTAALILPVMPDTTDLSGALNETGEIVITGSIELPKILGETGGHQSLHESIEAHEAVVMGRDVHELVLAPEPDGKPVAASKAISAQASATTLIGSQPERKGKLPLVLAITAGSLTVIVAGVFVWAASTGLFG